MSYSPTNWTSGDIITSQKLNKIEQGIVAVSNSSGGSIYNVNVGLDGFCDKTAGEIATAFLSGETVLFMSNDINNNIYIKCRLSSIKYGISNDYLINLIFYLSTAAAFTASFEEDYPGTDDSDWNKNIEVT